MKKVELLTPEQNYAIKLAVVNSMIESFMNAGIPIEKEVKDSAGKIADRIIKTVQFTLQNYNKNVTKVKQVKKTLKVKKVTLPKNFGKMTKKHVR